MRRRVRLAVEFAAPTIVSVLAMTATRPFRPATTDVVESSLQGLAMSAWTLGLAMAIMGLPSLVVGAALAVAEIRRTGRSGEHASVLAGTLLASAGAVAYLCWLYVA